MKKRTNACMDCKNGIVNNGTKRKTVEDRHNCIPNTLIPIISLALLVKSISTLKKKVDTNEDDRKRLSWFPRSRKISFG